MQELSTSHSPCGQGWGVIPADCSHCPVQLAKFGKATPRPSLLTPARLISEALYILRPAVYCMSMTSDVGLTVAPQCWSAIGSKALAGSPGFLHYSWTSAGTECRHGPTCIYPNSLYWLRDTDLSEHELGQVKSRALKLLLYALRSPFYESGVKCVEVRNC